MTNNFKQNKSQESILYNKILSLSRNKLFYTDFNLSDTFHNRIRLIFLHVSFLFIKIKQKNKDTKYKQFYQKSFDLIFKQIEINMREIGYGDVTVNKNMKLLVKIFYDILLNCEKYKDKSFKDKKLFLDNHLITIPDKKCDNNNVLIEYFDKYHTFCLDLSPNNVLNGDLNFSYN
tara:strand:- start:1001 stop:1525 length:525 start_codon:yes stop_codon:yes gene_type:complete